MSDFLKGNYKVQKEIFEKTESKEGAAALMEEVRKKALSSLGGSMVYMERNVMVWDGESESVPATDSESNDKK